jgi:hypothetical protein
MKKIILHAFACMICMPAFADKIEVPAQFPKIQLAINAARSGDTVVVSPGIYYENLNLHGKSLVLTSLFYEDEDTSYISQTIINGSQPDDPDSASCIMMVNHEDSTTVIQGFTLTGGTGTAWLDIHNGLKYREGGAIIMEFCRATIRYNYIHHNVAISKSGGMSSAGGGGIRCGDGNPLIVNNVFYENEGRYGGAIVFNYSKGKFYNNLVINNRGGEDYGGAGIWITGNRPNDHLVEVVNNTVAYNATRGPMTGSGGGTGGGLLVLSVKPILRNNIFWGNTQAYGPSVTGQVDAKYNLNNSKMSGEGNINIDPLFNPAGYTLAALSPAIDAGDTSAKYLDLEDAGAPGNALYPSQGSLRNDMGAYGGPYAMQPVSQLSLGIHPAPSASLKASDVYPNPAHDLVHIHLENAGNIRSVKMTDMLGREVSVNSKQEGQVLDVSWKDIQRGHYMLMITTNDQQRYTTKVLVN